jgi:hypothetical protein
LAQKTAEKSLEIGSKEPNLHLSGLHWTIFMAGFVVVVAFSAGSVAAPSIPSSSPPPLAGGRRGPSGGNNHPDQRRRACCRQPPWQGAPMTGREKKQEGLHFCCPSCCIAPPTIDTRTLTPSKNEAATACLQAAAVHRLDFGYLGIQGLSSTSNAHQSLLQP